MEDNFGNKEYTTHNADAKDGSWWHCFHTNLENELFQESIKLKIATACLQLIFSYFC